MDFSNLTNDNLMMYAMKSYDNPACHSVAEFSEDIDRVKYLKRLFKRYQMKGILKERLILNHIIVVYNVFGTEAATRILFFRLEQELWPILKTCLLFLNFMPDRVSGIEGKTIISSDIGLDQKLIDKLRTIG
jgi:hypothetical protein